jgi:hypothetical protein
MSVSARLATFAVVVVAAFGAAFGLGRAVGPIGEGDPMPVPADAPANDHGGGHGSDHGGGS